MEAGSHAREPLSRWLASRFFYPLLTVSSVALALFSGFLLTEGWPGVRLHVDLALAWVPYLCSLVLVALGQRAPERSLAWLGLLAGWLLFYPNAPYLVTDWMHLPGLQHELYYSIAMFTAFSLCGLQLSVVSLFLVHTLVRARHGRPAGLGVVGSAALLGGIGVYLGRFVRLNSWDLLTQPRAVLGDALAVVQEHLTGQSTPISFCLVFTIFLLMYYWIFLQFRNSPRSREEVASLRQRTG